MRAAAVLLVLLSAACVQPLAAQDQTRLRDVQRDQYERYQHSKEALTRVKARADFCLVGSGRICR